MSQYLLEAFRRDTRRTSELPAAFVERNKSGEAEL